jgi:hypothetical protein
MTAGTPQKPKVRLPAVLYVHSGVCGVVRIAQRYGTSSRDGVLVSVLAETQEKGASPFDEAREKKKSSAPKAEPKPKVEIKRIPKVNSRQGISSKNRPPGGGTAAKCRSGMVPLRTECGQ